MKIAVIPARGGSKRLPGKNIRIFNGVPMVVRAIRTAFEAAMFERIIVSTDDLEISKIAQSAGAEVPFIRPSSLANDTAGTVPVIAHTIEFLVAQGIKPSKVCCIYPCTPFLRTDDLLAAYTLLESSGEDFVYPVAEYPHPILRAIRLSKLGKTSFVFPENEMKRTQDLETTYHDVGQFYWGEADAWLAGKRMHTAGIGMVVPSWRFVDIDTEDDWHRAELISRALDEWSA